MNGEIPSVPITTLAGIASLTDLLPEMPLPSPLPQTLSNKSLLFHPRVAEEAKRLLSTHDEALIPQLIHSLMQTSADHIELKDPYAASEPLSENNPALLEAILHKSPGVFKGQNESHGSANSWNCVSSNQNFYNCSVVNQTSASTSPASASNYSPYPSPSSRHTPQGSPAPIPPYAQPKVLSNQGKYQVPKPLHSHTINTVSANAVQTKGNSSFIGSDLGNQVTHIQNTPNVGNSVIHYTQAEVNCSSVEQDKRASVITEHSQCSVRTSENVSNISGFSQSTNDLHVAQLPVNGLYNPEVSQSNWSNTSITLRKDEVKDVKEVKNHKLVPPSENLPASDQPVSVSNSEVTKLEPAFPEFSDKQTILKDVTLESNEPTAVSVEADKKEKKLPEKVSCKSPKTPAKDRYKSGDDKVKKDPGTDNENGDSTSENNRLTRSSRSQIGHINEGPVSDNESEEEEVNRTKYFKARAKERDIQRKKNKSEKRKSKKLSDSEDDEYVPEASPEKLKIRKRNASCLDSDKEESTLPIATPSKKEASEPVTIVPKKPKVRKIERCLIPVLEKLSPEELMESNNYQKFNRILELILDNTEDMELNTEYDEDTEVPQEALIPKYQLQDLVSEAAKLKLRNSTELIPTERLVRLLNILEKNIRDGAKVLPFVDPEEDEDESRLWLELAMDRVTRAVDASLTALHIMTSKNMSKRIYLEDVIERIVTFTKFQLVNTIYPSFDPVYRDPKTKEGIIGNMKKKRAHAKEVRHRTIIQLYNKFNEVVNMLSSLLTIQIMTDTTILQLSTLGVAPFFVENVNDLQLSALRLVTIIFSNYEKHRRLLLDDILASIARLPSSKRSLRTYRLRNSSETVQMLTALVLQLIQCVVVIRPPASKSSNKHKKVNGDGEGEKEASVMTIKTQEVDLDVLISNKYDMARRTAANFLSVFLTKCSSKNEEIDYRPLFENFIQDLLAAVNRPEWPAAELLLSLLGKILVQNFIQKSCDMPLRVASLDYLGVIASRLRRDAVTSILKVDAIDQLIADIKDKEAEFNLSQTTKQKEQSNVGDDEEERTEYLQRILLDYLTVNSDADPSMLHARQFYLAQWYNDAYPEIFRQKWGSLNTPRKKKKARKKRKGSDTEDSDDSESEKPASAKEEAQKAEVMRLVEIRKQFLASKIQPFYEKGGRLFVTELDDESCFLIARYLSSKREFSQSFDMYLKQMLRVLTEQAIAVRTKAMKCLTMVVEADPSVLARQDMQLGVNHSFLDHSTSVREAAVDLVGKFVLSRPELIDKYYEMLSARILDTGVSVRKRVIKIMKDICMECPEFTKIPEICVKMIRRVNDEEGIKKLVQEVFQNMWFTPVSERPNSEMKSLVRKVMNITDVVAACQETGLDWFEQLLVTLFKPREDKEDSTKVITEPPKSLLLACKQIVDCLVKKILQLEEDNPDDQTAPVTDTKPQTVREPNNRRIVACMQTLYMFAKIRPKLLVNHAITLQPYLSLKSQNKGDDLIISCVAKMIELVVPLMEHPSETFLAQLEEDCVKLILQHEKGVVQSCVSCLGSVVNSVTYNYQLIRDCFNKYYKIILDYKVVHEISSTDPKLIAHRPWFRRALFTIGLLIKHFDFTLPEVYIDLTDDIVDQVMELMMYFMEQPEEDVQGYTLQAIGFIGISHVDFMLGSALKSMYSMLLSEPRISPILKVRVLQNLESYLVEEEMRMVKQDQEWNKLKQKENLKEMNESSSGMASTVIQIYLKNILDCFLHPKLAVRHAALKVIQLILSQGLVYPIQILPYLICMSTDMEQTVSHSADKQLQEIDKKYPGFIASKAMLGIRLSYEFQSVMQSGSRVVRGFKLPSVSTELPTAFNGFLYSILRNTKQQRRSLLLIMLKKFEEQSRFSLSQCLYLADNLAYFPYQVADEPLFIIHNIDVIVSCTGSFLVQSFKENLMGPDGHHKVNPDTNRPVVDDDEDDDIDALYMRLPADITALEECMASSQSCLLLLVLKQHLKAMYGITDNKIAQYSPTESAKIYEKAISRKGHNTFNPTTTLMKLQEKDTQRHTEQYRKNLIEQYIDFKQLMLKLDPADDEEDDTVPAGHMSIPSCKIVVDAAQQANPGVTDGQQGHEVHNLSSGDAKVSQSLNCNSDSTMPKVPKLLIVTPKPHKHHHHKKAHKSEKHKRKKKKKKKLFGSDSDNQTSGDSDPDFMA